MMKPVEKIPIYHIVHFDRLKSIIESGGLFCDKQVIKKNPPGTSIGMSTIKERRLNELTLTSHPDLFVGQCVPFYFCPRSIMLYLIYKANHQDLSYQGGQERIIHLKTNLLKTVNWANENHLKWAFTLSNAGSKFFEDRNDLSQLSELDWSAIESRNWQKCSDQKQAEFLIENKLPWHLIEGIGVQSQRAYDKVNSILQETEQSIPVKVKRDWYY